MADKFYDISIPITSEMIIWPGDSKVTIRQVSAIKEGADSNVSQLRMSVHTGTHIDAPKHFVDDGKTIDQIPLGKLTGPSLVMEIGQTISIITRNVLLKHSAFHRLEQAKKVLFKTRNSLLWHEGGKIFKKNYVGLDSSAAQLLADMDFDLVGVDYLSIAPFNETEAPHQILLEKEVVLLEGIDLSGIPQGFYELFCLPLLLQNCEGSPARAILRKTTACTD